MSWAGVSNTMIVQIQSSGVVDCWVNTKDEQSWVPARQVPALWFLYKYLDTTAFQCQSGPIFTIVNMGYLKHAALCLGKSEIFLVVKYFCSWNIFHLVCETLYDRLVHLDAGSSWHKGAYHRTFTCMEATYPLCHKEPARCKQSPTFIKML